MSRTGVLLFAGLFASLVLSVAPAAGRDATRPPWLRDAIARTLRGFGGARPTHIDTVRYPHKVAAVFTFARPTRYGPRLTPFGYRGSGSGGSALPPGLPQLDRAVARVHHAAGLPVSVAQGRRETRRTGSGMVVRMERESRTDAELLRHSRRDPDAFVLVCRRHAAALDGWLTVQVRDAGLARELLAETFSEAWFSRGRFSDPGDGDARPWLFGIARNLVRRVYRDRAVASRGRARLGLPVAAPDEYGEVIDRLAAGQTLGSLDEQLAGLPETQRDALELRVVHELDYREIGQRLAITPEGARTRVFRALATLRAQIGRST